MQRIIRQRYITVTYAVLVAIGMITTAETVQAAGVVPGGYSASWPSGATYGNPPHSWSGGATMLYPTPAGVCTDPVVVAYLNTNWSYTPIQSIYVVGTAFPFTCHATSSDINGAVYPAADYAGARVVYGNGCPNASTPSSSGCTCNDTFKPDVTGTKCVSDCPVAELTPLSANDTCAQSLENGAGVDVNNACPSVTPEMQGQAQCVADKIRRLALPIPYTGPSATIRNTAYQNHLLAVWKKSKEIKKKVTTNAQKQACAAVIADVGNEMMRHGIDSPPSSSGNQAPHVKGRAIDIPKNVAKALTAQVTAFITVPKPPGCLPCNDTVTFISDVQDYVNSPTVNPPACTLRWGGRFKRYDSVHFQLP